MTCPRTALAKVEVGQAGADGKVVYTDFLSLLKLGVGAAARWTVVSKIYAARPLTSPSFSEPAAATSTTHADIVAALQSYFAGQVASAFQCALAVFCPGDGGAALRTLARAGGGHALDRPPEPAQVGARVGA